MQCSILKYTRLLYFSFYFFETPFFSMCLSDHIYSFFAFCVHFVFSCSPFCSLIVWNSYLLLVLPPLLSSFFCFSLLVSFSFLVFSPLLYVFVILFLLSRFLDCSMCFVSRFLPCCLYILFCICLAVFLFALHSCICLTFLLSPSSRLFCLISCSLFPSELLLPVSLVCPL